MTPLQSYAILAAILAIAGALLRHLVKRWPNPKPRRRWYD